MNKKGFTLIELLAVIIALAIIALIATPIVLNVISDAEESAAQSEANLVLKAINNYCDQIEVIKKMEGLGENDFDCYEESKNKEITLTKGQLLKMVKKLSEDTIVDAKLLNGELVSLTIEKSDKTFVYVDSTNTMEEIESLSDTCFVVSSGVITEYKCDYKNIIIPSKINNMTITGIGDSVFKDKGLNSVQLPDTLISIGDSAFYNNNLISIILPDSLQSIGEDGLAKNNITYLTLPSSINSLGEDFLSSSSDTVTIVNTTSKTFNWPDIFLCGVGNPSGSMKTQYAKVIGFTGKIFNIIGPDGTSGRVFDYSGKSGLDHCWY